MKGIVLLDWGSTHLRAHRLDDEGRLLESRAGEDGILFVPDADFEKRLRRLVPDWLVPGVRILASGMITSRQGWVETPYIECPCSIDELAGGVTELRLAGGEAIAFVPGLRMGPPLRDVMRGEEVQILGLGGEGVIVLPGTHAKWALVGDGRVERFATFMTGELFDVLLNYSILGRPAKGREHDEARFFEGVRRGAAARDEGGLTHVVFSARTLLLAGDLPPEGVASYVSGMLIGDEIVQARSLFGEAAESCRIVGAPALAGLYMSAFAELGLTARNEGENATLAGLKKIARTLGWLV
jgi:2-dehydro-3-deoxygalactonokinase